MASEEPLESPVESPLTAQIDVPDSPASAEWPPREWREAQRGGGNKGVYQVVGLIFGIMALLVVLSFWGMSNG